MGLFSKLVIATVLLFAPVDHFVQLTWVASASPNVVGYNVYRATPDAQGALNWVLQNDAPVVGITYEDDAVDTSQVYFYQVTAVDDQGNESAPSDQAEADWMIRVYGSSGVVGSGVVWRDRR